MLVKLSHYPNTSREPWKSAHGMMPFNPGTN